MKITEWRGNVYDSNVPEFYEFGIIFGIILIEDLWFYTIHKSLHSSKYLYEKIHKFHHKVTPYLTLVDLA